MRGKKSASRFAATDDLSEIQIPCLQQHHQVIEEISRFVNDCFPIACDGCKRQLHAFFADLLGDTLTAARGEARRIAVVLRIVQPVANDRFKRYQEPKIVIAHVGLLRA